VSKLIGSQAPQDEERGRSFSADPAIPFRPDPILSICEKELSDQSDGSETEGRGPTITRLSRAHRRYPWPCELGQVARRLRHPREG